MSTETKPDMSEEEFRQRMAAKRAALAKEIAETERQIEAKRPSPSKPANPPPAVCPPNLKDLLA